MFSAIGGAAAAMGVSNKRSLQCTDNEAPVKKRSSGLEFAAAATSSPTSGGVNKQQQSAGKASSSSAGPQAMCGASLPPPAPHPASGCFMPGMGGMGMPGCPMPMPGMPWGPGTAGFPTPNGANAAMGVPTMAPMAGFNPAMQGGGYGYPGMPSFMPPPAMMMMWMQQVGMAMAWSMKQQQQFMAARAAGAPAMPGCMPSFPMGCPPFPFPGSAMPSAGPNPMGCMPGTQQQPLSNHTNKQAAPGMIPTSSLPSTGTAVGTVSGKGAAGNANIKSSNSKGCFSFLETSKSGDMSAGGDDVSGSHAQASDNSHASALTDVDFASLIDSFLLTGPDHALLGDDGLQVDLISGLEDGAEPGPLPLGLKLSQEALQDLLSTPQAATKTCKGSAAAAAGAGVAKRSGGAAQGKGAKGMAC